MVRNDIWNSAPLGIADANQLEEMIKICADTDCKWLGYLPHFSQHRINDIYIAWKEDLKRSQRDFLTNRVNEIQSVTPDHFKAAACLTYWIRRETPILQLENINTDTVIVGDITEYDAISEAEMLDMGFGENQYIPNGRNFLLTYVNHYFAFKLGFELAACHEALKCVEKKTVLKVDDWYSSILRKPSSRFIQDYCYASKFKNLSPHGLDLIFRAFMNK